MRVPTAFEPVKETRSTPGCSTSGAPHRSPPPCTRLNTPAGTPACSSSRARWNPVSGESSDGLNTTVFPATSAGKIFQVGTAKGKFQAVITATTPTGARTDIAHLSDISLGVVTPYSRRPSPAARNAMSIPSWMSPRVSSRILPISRVAARASSSLRAAIRAPSRNRISARLGAGVSRQPGFAA